MQSSTERRMDALGGVLPFLFAWWVLYGLPLLFRAGSYDASHVLCEGVSAVLLLAAARRERDAGPPRPAGRTRWLALLIFVPMFFFDYVALQTFCQAGAGPCGSSVRRPVWYVLRTCVTAPLMEELGCRWIGFYKLRHGFGFWPSALASAALFSLIHVEVSGSLAIAVIPDAFLHCLIYEVTGRLWCCVASHAAYNILALPGMPWSDNVLDGIIAWGVSRRTGVPILVAFTAAVVLLCAFRDRIFVRRGGRPGAPGAPTGA